MTHHDVSVPVEEFEELLQTPEAAFEALQNKLCHFVFSSLQLRVGVFEQYADQLHYSNDESAKCERARVVPGKK